MKIINHLVIAGCVIAALNASSTAQDQWTRRNPFPTERNLNAVVWTGAQAVSVGNSGVIVTSPDGVTWTNRTSGTANNLRGIAWTGAHLTAVGDSGTIVTSPDGITWTSRSSGTKQTLVAVGCHGEQLVALGRRDTILTSSGGETWTIRTIGSRSRFGAILWADSQFIAVGDSVFISRDGSTWTCHPQASVNQLGGIAWSGNLFVAVSIEGIQTSIDGATWSFCPPTNAQDLRNVLRTVVWIGDKFVAIGDTIVTSPDGTTWTGQIKSPSTLYGMAWTGSQIVAVGCWGMIMTSPEGENWTERTRGTIAHLRDVIAVHGLLTVVGSSGTIETSPDGVTWTRQSSGTTNPLRAIAYTGEQYVAVGEWGSALTSQNGIDWTVRSTGTAHGLTDVVWTGSQLVAVGYRCLDLGGGSSRQDGSGVILTSPDGTNWTEQPQSGKIENLTNVVWTGTQLVAVGNAIFSSPDGVTWTKISGDDAMIGIAWNGSRYVAVGWSPSNDSIIRVSDDGLTWSKRSAGGLSKYGAPELLNVSWTGDRFMAVGLYGLIIVSPDGDVWTRQQSGTENALYGITATGTQRIAVGDGGGIFTSSTTPMPVRKLTTALPSISELNLSLKSTTRTRIRFSCELSRPSPISVVLYSFSGKTLLKQKTNAGCAGRQVIIVPIEPLTAGAYLLETSASGSVDRRWICVK